MQPIAARIIDAVCNLTGEGWKGRTTMRCDKDSLLLYAVTDQKLGKT